MHPTVVEALAHDRVAELRRDALQPHVPEGGGRAARRPFRERMGAAIAAVERRIRRPRISTAG